MCECASETRPTLINRLASFFRPAEPPPALTDEDIDAARNERRAAAVAAGFAQCRRCGCILEEGDEDALHQNWCYTCDAKWFESQICKPLVKRLGRKGAVRAFARLVSDVKRLVG
jgi:hypothetical protein